MITKTAITILAASLAATLAIPVTAMAEGECQQDRQKFCKNETRANVGACLDQHTDELSEACKAMREARALAYEKYYLQAIRGPGQMVAALHEPAKKWLTRENLLRS